MGNSNSCINYDQNVQLAMVVPHEFLSSHARSEPLLLATPLEEERRKTETSFRKVKGKRLNKKFEKRILERQHSSAIDRQLLLDYNTKRKAIHVLFVGLRNSGKSTIQKQLMLNYKPYWTGADDFDAKEARKNMNKTIFKGLSKLLLLAKGEGCLEKRLEVSRRKILQMEDFKNPVVDAETAQLIFNVWNEPSIQAIWQKYRFRIEEEQSLSYFMENKSIFQEDYNMTVRDWLHARNYSTRLTEEEIIVDRVAFALNEIHVDVGKGSRSFIGTYFDKSHVVFVVDISDYDTIILSNTSSEKTKLHEALDLFDEVLNNREWKSTGIVLIFNKADILREKLRQRPLLKRFWPDFEEAVEDDEMEAYKVKIMGFNEIEFEEYVSRVYEYLNALFCKGNDSKNTREVYPHLTTAFDQNIMNIIFDASKDMILREVLREQGFVA